MKNRAWLWILALPTLDLTAACNSTWTGATNSNWSISGNWNPCVPSVAGDTALFPSLSSATDTVTVNLSETVTNLTLDAANTQYTFTNILSRTLTFSAYNSTLPTFDVVAGSHTFQTLVNSVNDTTLTVDSPLLFDINSSYSSSAGVTVYITGSSTLTNKGESGFSPQILIIEPGVTVSNLGAFGLMGFDTQAVTINGGTVSNEGLIGVSCATLTINGGAINNYNQGILGLAGSINPMLLTINGGTITNNDSFIGHTYSTTPMTITMNGGMLYNQAGSEFAEKSDFIMTGGLFNNDPTSTIGPANVTLRGGTLINDGLLQLMGNGGDVLEVTGSATLSGTGHIANLNPGTAFTLQNSATVIPGDGALTLDAEGTYLQTSGGKLVINVASTTSFGQLAAYNASLNGTLEVAGTPGLRVTPGVELPILITTNGVSGTFAKVEGFDLPPLTVPFVTYLPDSVLLSFSPILTQHVAYFYLPILSAINQINTRIDLLLEEMRGRCCCPGFNLYAAATGSAGSVQSRRHLIGFNYGAAGGLLGMDYANGWGGLGFMVDYERIEGKPKHQVRKIDIDHIHGSLYGTFFATEALALNGIVGGGYDFTTLKRRTGYSNELLATGKPSIDHFDAYLGAEYAINPCISPVVWTPVFALQYMHLNIGKYQEKGAPAFEFIASGRHIESFRTILGLKTYCPLFFENVVVTPEINFFYQREFLNERHFSTFAPVVAGLPFSLEVKGPHRSIFLIGCNLPISFCNGWGIEIGYEYEGGTTFYNHFFYGQAQFAF